MTKLARLLLAAASVLLLVMILCEGSAWAGSTTLAIVIEGAPASLRGAIGNELPSPWTQVDASVVATAAKKRQLSKSLKALDDSTTKSQYTTKLGQVASDVGAGAAVTIIVYGKGNDRRGHVVLVSESGEAVVDTYVVLGAPADDGPPLAKAFTGKLDAIANPPAVAVKPEPAAAAPAPAETPKPDAPASAAPPPPGKDATPTAPPSQPAGAEPPPILVGTLAFEIANRHLSLRRVSFANPLGYDSGLVLTPALAVDLFPAARSGTKVLEDFGLFGDFKIGLGQNASWTRFDAGLKYRIWLGRRDWNAFMLAPSVSYGQESYASDTANETKPPVSYKFIRPRVDLRVPVWRIAILAGGGFLAALDSGDFADKFRDATVIGWEADLAVTVPLNKFLEIRAGFGYRRIIYFFSPQTGDPNFARGAHDQTFRPDIGITAHL